MWNWHQRRRHWSAKRLGCDEPRRPTQARSTGSWHHRSPTWAQGMSHRWRGRRRQRSRSLRLVEPVLGNLHNVSDFGCISHLLPLLPLAVAPLYLNFFALELDFQDLRAGNRYRVGFRDFCCQLLCWFVVLATSDGWSSPCENAANVSASGTTFAKTHETFIMCPGTRSIFDERLG